MISGSCLCEGVQFEVAKFAAPFELCHCNRCRKVSGSAFMAGIAVHRDDFTWLCGRDLVRAFEAPIIDHPPAYRVCFCSRCGSPVPDPDNDAETFELPAGLLARDPNMRPDKHIYVDYKAPWHEISDSLPQFDKRSIALYRAGDRDRK